MIVLCYAQSGGHELGLLKIRVTEWDTKNQLFLHK